jgi:hypothetical protein
MENKSVIQFKDCDERDGFLRSVYGSELEQDPDDIRERQLYEEQINDE